MQRARRFWIVVSMVLLALVMVVIGTIQVTRVTASSRAEEHENEAVVYRNGQALWRQRWVRLIVALIRKCLDNSQAVIQRVEWDAIAADFSVACKRAIVSVSEPVSRATSCSTGQTTNDACRAK